MHATPFEPQAWFEVPGWQTLFWQQPEGQLAAVHTHDPLLHSLPAGQVMQAAPEGPRAAFVLPDLHVWVAASQQPVEQRAAVHPHEPFWHSVP